MYILTCNKNLGRGRVSDGVEVDVCGSDSRGAREFVWSLSGVLNEGEEVEWQVWIKGIN